MRLKNRIAIGAVAALTALTAPTVVASAQQPQDVPLSTVVAVGTSVRVTSTAVGGKLQGIVAAVDEKLLTLSRDGGPPVTMPLTSSRPSTCTLAGNGTRSRVPGLVLWVVPLSDCSTQWTRTTLAVASTRRRGGGNSKVPVHAEKP